LVSGCNYVYIGGEKISIELADTPEEMNRGLMGRETLCDSCGMLFIFQEEDYFSFWMKNTLIPLDMVFINSNMTIIDVLHATPCEKEPCQIYTPKEKAQYVLETNGGKFDYRIIGEKVIIK
ncbi:MAG: DUF192 domain-containing protein, partial [Nanoarchaeota archaeon]